MSGEFMRKLATIRKVDEIRPIEGADAIELAVFRSVDETPSNQGKISFKAISNKYLLKQDG